MKRLQGCFFIGDCARCVLIQNLYLVRVERDIKIKMKMEMVVKAVGTSDRNDRNV